MTAFRNNFFGLFSSFILKDLLNFFKKNFHQHFNEHGYYFLGLVIQKGLPFVVVPLITWSFGKAIYANYVFIFSVVQFLAVFVGMGCVNSVIIFWNQNKDKNKYISQFLSLLVLLHLLATPVVFYFLKYYLLVKDGIPDSLGFVLLILFYIFSYNCSLIGVGVLRAKMLAKNYFYLTLCTSALFCLLVVLSSYYAKNIDTLVNVYALTNIAQAGLFMIFAKLKVDFSKITQDFISFVKQILIYSIPIMLNGILSASLFTIDKWIVKFYFPSDFFIDYVYDFQFAFVVSLVCVALNMQSVPLFCRLLYDKKHSNIKPYLLHCHKLIIYSSVCLAVASYLYAYLTHIHLDYGYWLFCLAFALAGVFSINISLLESLQVSKKILWICFWPTAIFWVCFGIGAWLGFESPLYLGYIAYYAWMALSSSNCIKKIEHNSWQYYRSS